MKKTVSPVDPNVAAPGSSARMNQGPVLFWTGQSGSGARSLRLFIRLQGELNVTGALGLPLGVDLRGTGVKGQHGELRAKPNERSFSQDNDPN